LIAKKSCLFECYLITKTMTEREQIQVFAEDLGRLIDCYSDEFDLTVAGIIGVLECAKLEVWDGSKDGDMEIEIG